MYSENNKRIAKNTLVLYFRMLFSMGVSLYTSRVVLNTLGVEDFGIYNVVGGIIAMLSFLNASMASSTQRFLTFEIGKGDQGKINKVFSISVLIHISLSFIVLFLGETIGLWFFKTKMTIPPDRINAAMWVYQFSIFSTMVIISSIPYNALIIAHEKMSVFAYISIVEVSLKLLIVFLLMIINFDKLVIYGVLIFLVTLIVRICYSVYCRRRFKDIKYTNIKKDKVLIREMTSYAGWSLWGNSAAIIFTEGLNLLLNVFFYPAVNAARGIAVQVQNAVAGFCNNFQVALNPQITKSYAGNDLVEMHFLIFKSSKYSFFLLYFLSLPIFFSTDFILRMWLKTVPPYTCDFVRLILCISLIDATANPFMTAAGATGKIKKYHTLIGGTLLLILPISYICLKLGSNPVSVFIVHLTVCSFAFFLRLYIIKPLINLSIKMFFKNILLKIFLVVIASLPLPFFISNFMSDGIIKFLIVSSSCVISTLFAYYVIGLSKNEQVFFRKKLTSIIKRI